MPVERVLLHVDDDPQITRLVQARLKPRGFRSVPLNDPSQCLPTLRDQHIRAVLLDIDMPGISGLELLQRIKHEDGGVQVVMLTGLVTMSTVLQSLRWGAEACLFKPVNNVDVLAEALDRTFAKLDAWWNTLEELRIRRQLETANRDLQPATANK